MSAVENTVAFTLARQPLELRRRRVRVRSVHHLTPACVRVVFEGADLAGFTSLAADDHLRIFFPPPGEPLPHSDGEGMPAGLVSREFTPFTWDGLGWLAIDFVRHGEGVASRWVDTVRPGDEVYIGGPRGSLVMTGAPDWWLLAGDLTALPAIRRHLNAVAPGTPVDVVVLSDDSADAQELTSPGELSVRWVQTAVAAPPGDIGALVDALHELPPRDGDGFAFIAAEQSIVAPARAFLSSRGVDLERAVVKGYWKRDVAEYHAPHGTAGS